MGEVIEGFFFLVKTKQETRKTQIDPLIFMNENDTIRQNSVWTMHGRVIRPAQT